MKYLLVLVFVIIIIALGPLITIWGLNTLFPVLDIPYAFDTWCAIIIIGAVLRANVSVKKD